MILTIGGIKGGSGKTTVATNLACIAAGLGKDVLLVDADEQETSYDFTVLRKQDHPDAPAYTCIKLTGKAVRTEVLAMAPKYDHVIIDAGGRETTSQRAALSVSHTLIVPVLPRSFDVWTIAKVKHIVEEMATVNEKLRAYVFLSRTDPQGWGSDNREAAELLREIGTLAFLDCPIGNRKAFAHAASQGLAVTELQGRHANPKANEEIVTLYQRCVNVEMKSPELHAVAG